MLDFLAILFSLKSDRRAVGDIELAMVVSAAAAISLIGKMSIGISL